MPLQTSGAISLNDIHVEAGGTSGTTCKINDSDIRSLSPASGYILFQRGLVLLLISGISTAHLRRLYMWEQQLLALLNIPTGTQALKHLRM